MAIDLAETASIALLAKISLNGYSLQIGMVMTYWRMYP
jgi:hypothetical protein